MATANTEILPSPGSVQVDPFIPTALSSIPHEGSAVPQQEVPIVEKPISSTDQTASVSRSPLAFPESGYVGVAAKWADLMSRHYESPRVFLYFDLLTLIGTALSGRVRVDFGDLVTQPRLYLLKIGKSGWRRKSTSTALAEKFLASAEKAVFKPNEVLDTAAPTGKWVKVIPGAGSGEGLAMALKDHRRVVVLFDELRRFERKASIDGSVLVSIVNEMFDRNSYANVTKTTQFEVSYGHLGFLANTTDETFERLVDASELVDIGFLNRFLLIPSFEAGKRFPIPVAPDEAELAPIRQELAAYFLSLPPLLENRAPKEEVVITLTPEAREMWIDWYLNVEEVEETTRLDNIGARLMGLLAFTSGKKQVDAELMGSILDILEYQRQVRERYKPIEGETIEAKLEGRIIGQLKMRGPLTKNELRRFTNAARVGTRVFDETLSNLQKAGRVTKVFLDGKKAKVQKFVLPAQQE